MVVAMLFFFTSALEMLPPDGKEELTVFRRNMLGLPENPEDAESLIWLLSVEALRDVVQPSAQPVLDVKSL